jgi:hypothetical protein
MAHGQAIDADFFRRCALVRYEEATVLFDSGFTTGAVYRAGDAIECILKALLLSPIPARKQAEAMRSFRGNQGHDLTWLRDQYFLRGGARFTPSIQRSFTLVNAWSTDLRYSPRKEFRDADRFLSAAEALLVWGKGRLRK